MKTIEGSQDDAKVKRVLTSFSLSPCHLLASEDDDIEKNVASLSYAIALPISVLPKGVRDGHNSMSLEIIVDVMI